jgi:hypothetical protein
MYGSHIADDTRRGDNLSCSGQPLTTESIPTPAFRQLRLTISSLAARYQQVHRTCSSRAPRFTTNNST